jgi:hypothetical protein
VWRVVEEKLVAGARVPRAVFTQTAQQRRVIPFVCDYNIRVSERSVEIDVQRVVKTTPQERINCVKCLDHAVATLLAQVVEAPSIRRLEDLDRVALGQQFAGNTPQNVGAGMIPVGNEGVVEQDEAHARSPARPAYRPGCAKLNRILRSKNRICIKHRAVHADTPHCGPFRSLN